MAKWNFINRVIFINPILSIKNVVNRGNGNFDSNANNYHRLFPSYITPKLLVYTPINVLPNREFLKPFKKLGIRIILGIIRQLNSDKPYILFMNCPNIYSHYVLDELLKNAKMSIFDFSDDFAELGYNKETIEFFRCNIARYAKAADIVLTVNDHIRDKYSYLNSNIYVLRNATNYDNFDRKDYKRIDVLEKIKDKKKPIIGYSGLANMSRIDADLLDYLFEKRKEWQFVFVGPAKSNFVERYSLKNNFHSIPAVDYQILPDYLRYFDVAIVPFKKNDHTLGNDLLKFHDYLAMGKPVVSTDIGGANDLKDVIRISFTKVDFLQQIEDALVNENSENILKRKNRAFKNSWHNRIKELEDLIKGHLKYN